MYSTSSTVCFAFLIFSPYFCQADIRITRTYQGNVMEVEEHRQLTLECRSTTSHVDWSFDGQKIANTSGRFTIWQQKTETGGLVSYLQMVRAEPVDAGTYACYCPHSKFNDEVTVKVKSYERHSHVSIEGPKTLVLDLGSHLQLVCKSGLYTTANWVANGNYIRNSTRDTITVTSDDANQVKTVVLVRKSLEARDFGQYVCQNLEDSHDKAIVEVQRSEERSGFERKSIAITGVALGALISLLIVCFQH